MARRDRCRMDRHQCRSGALQSPGTHVQLPGRPRTRTTLRATRSTCAATPTGSTRRCAPRAAEAPPGLLFANLYYSVRSGPGPFGNAGQSIAFEITNDRAFNPNIGTPYPDNGSNLIQYVTSSSVGNPDILESAIDLSVFWNNALGVGGFDPDPNAVGIRLNLSQSFGYSVAGGQADYGDSRLGYVSADS